MCCHCMRGRHSTKTPVHFRHRNRMPLLANSICCWCKQVRAKRGHHLGNIVMPRSTQTRTMSSNFFAHPECYHRTVGMYLLKQKQELEGQRWGARDRSSCSTQRRGLLGCRPPLQWACHSGRSRQEPVEELVAPRSSLARPEKKNDLKHRIIDTLKMKFATHTGPGSKAYKCLREMSS